MASPPPSQFIRVPTHNGVSHYPAPNDNEVHFYGNKSTPLLDEASERGWEKKAPTPVGTFTIQLEWAFLRHVVVRTLSISLSYIFPYLLSLAGLRSLTNDRHTPRRRDRKVHGRAEREKMEKPLCKHGSSHSRGKKKGKTFNLIPQRSHGFHHD